MIPLPPDLLELAAALRREQIEVRFESPPKRGAYGLYSSSKRRIWVSPLTFDLGILRQTFLHEAVHAVQGCRFGRVQPLGIKTDLTPVVKRRIRYLLHSSYAPRDAAIEREAFEIASRPDAVPLLMRLLRQRCKAVSP